MWTRKIQKLHSFSGYSMALVNLKNPQLAQQQVPTSKVILCLFCGKKQIFLRIRSYLNYVSMFCAFFQPSHPPCKHKHFVTPTHLFDYVINELSLILVCFIFGQSVPFEVCQLMYKVAIQFQEKDPLKVKSLVSGFWLAKKGEKKGKKGFFFLQNQCR